MEEKVQFSVKMTPISKQSKKMRKKYYSAKRGGWNGISPVTRVVPSRKVYNRKRTKQEDSRMMTE